MLCSLAFVSVTSVLSSRYNQYSRDYTRFNESFSDLSPKQPLQLEQQGKDKPGKHGFSDLSPKQPLQHSVPGYRDRNLLVSVTSVLSSRYNEIEDQLIRLIVKVSVTSVLSSRYNVFALIVTLTFSTFQ